MGSLVEIFVETIIQFLCFSLPFRYGVIRVLPVDSSQHDILSDDIPLD